MENNKYIQLLRGKILELQQTISIDLALIYTLNNNEFFSLDVAQFLATKNNSLNKVQGHKLYLSSTDQEIKCFIENKNIMLHDSIEDKIDQNLKYKTVSRIIYPLISAQSPFVFLIDLRNKIINQRSTDWPKGVEFKISQFSESDFETIKGFLKNLHNEFKIFQAGIQKAS